MGEASSRERGNYHLTYGELVDFLKSAPKNKKFDSRINGIGSYRGYYTDIALFTDEYGLSVEDEEFNGDYKEYEKWRKEHRTSIDELPRNANELGELLESLIGKDFSGYKGGNYTITREKPLWFENEDSNASERAVISIDENLKITYKELE